MSSHPRLAPLWLAVFPFAVAPPATAAETVLVDEGAAVSATSLQAGFGAPAGRGEDPDRYYRAVELR